MIVQNRRLKPLNMHNIKLRTGYILKPGFSFRALRPYCQSIVYATDGYRTAIDEIAAQLSAAFVDFDPEKDCIVPVGNAITNLLAGYLLAARFPHNALYVALYNKEVIDEVQGRQPEDYTFYRIPLMLLRFDGNLETTLEGEN